eukprot:GHVT01043858.1.p1 GENE.GHVT01043858.1~~GHVT01043858.1.p1  ORF type:complete len:100 (-),score=21.46 GHVT01043858.1:436-735(-)
MTRRSRHHRDFRMRTRATKALSCPSPPCHLPLWLSSPFRLPPFISAPFPPALFPSAGFPSALFPPAPFPSASSPSARCRIFRGVLFPAPPPSVSSRNIL